MNCCFTVVNNVLDSAMTQLPENLAAAPWSIVTATVCFLTALMFIFMPTLTFITYSLYTALLSAIFLKYKDCIFAPSWSRRLVPLPEIR